MRSLLLLLCLGGLVACDQLNPNAGRFSCDGGLDCGEGFECRPQFDGGGYCFKAGQCVDLEVCDGTDQNCDGRIDETFPEAGAACQTGQLGQCAAGTRICTLGSLGCQRTVGPSAELCNGLDDNCDGTVDERFDLSSDSANCGACGQVCDAGTTCFASACQETSCDDGVDNDGDGVTDCLDQSCLGQTCVSPMAPSWRCGALKLDGGSSDAGAPDAGPLDAGPDAGSPDAGSPDAGSLDAGSPDAGSPDAGPDAGMDAGAPDAGPVDAGAWDGGPVLGCYPPEQDCANGFDDDGDGEADCLDVDCAGQVCASGTTCTNRSCPGPG